jgi:two-component system, chemotaxis family, chemotaxis protein CheY
MILIKLRALVVDDSDTVRQLTMNNLKDTGLAEFKFTEAVDGCDALRKMETGDFHIAFVDWTMPNLDGVEFIRTVRDRAKSENREPIPMMLFSGERTLGQIQEAMDEAGAEAFLSKPYTQAELTKKLDRLVQLAVDVRVRQMRKDHKNAAPVSGSVFAKLFG